MERVDLFVIGGGGIGSDITGILAGAGMNVVMAERSLLGGECSNYGCDPTKAMLKAARIVASARRAGDYGVRIPTVEVDLPTVMRRVRSLVDEEVADGAKPFEALGARVIMQEARLTGPHRVELADGTVFAPDRIVLATGSEPTAPPVPGLDRGGYWTSKEAIWHGGDVPSSLLVLGAGAIGIEFAQIYARFGSRVTVIEALPAVLAPEDEASSGAIAEALAAEGITLHVGAKATRAERTADDGWRLQIEGLPRPVEGEKLLVATGRRPCFDGHDLDAAGVELDARERPVLTDTLRTTAPHIWAGGDATGELLFTHVGAYEGDVIAADIKGRPFPRDYRVVPKVTYCEPEVASVGLTEREAREAEHDVVTGRSSFEDSARAFIEGEQRGQVKIVADRATGQVLGGHIVGEHAGELIHEVVAIMVGHVSPSTISNAIHAYPTLAESVRWACREVAEQLAGGRAGRFPH